MRDCPGSKGVLHAEEGVSVGCRERCECWVQRNVCVLGAEEGVTLVGLWREEICCGLDIMMSRVNSRN